MSRPRSCRRIAGLPPCLLFKPAGVPAATLREVILEMDELEAIRLADLEGLYHEQAAARMNVSRQTFGRIVESGRRKVAQVLVEGQSLRIEGGVVEMAESRTFECLQCRHVWQLPFGTGRPDACPLCGGANIRRSLANQGGPGAGQVRAPGPDRGRGRCRRRGR